MQNPSLHSGLYLKKNKLSISFLILSMLIMFGSSYRYIRIFYPEINYLPYFLELLLWTAVALKLFSVNKIKTNMIDFIMLLSLALSSISFLVLSLRFGLNTQLVFFATYALPLSIYFYVKNTPSFDIFTLDRFLKIFTIFGLFFITIEFYSINFTNSSIFNFALFWEIGNVEGFLRSKVRYAFIGDLIRPWGFMAMPQSTGSMFSALGIYFLSKYLLSKKLYRRRSDLGYMTLSLIGVYVSGSRTAVVIFVLMLVFISRKRPVQLAFSTIFGFLGALTLISLPRISFEGYSNIVPRFFEGLTIDSLDRL